MWRLLRRLLQASLARRLLGTLMLCFVLVSAVLLAQSWFEYQASMKQNPGVRQYGSLVASALDGIDDEATAARVLHSLATRTNALRRETALLPGDLLLQLYDAQGRRIYASAESDAVSQVGMAEQQLLGVRHWTWREDGPRWSLRIAEPMLPDRSVLSWLLLELGSSMLIAFPLVLLPLWLAVYTGLAPLRRLARRLASVDADPKLAPLDVDLRYAELRPLGQAFDALMERLRRRLARERAFVHDAAHELRTPLAVIATQTHLLTGARDEAERQEAAEQLLASIRRTAKLSQQLLDLAALDREVGIEPSPVDLASLSAQLLAAQGGMARERGLTLELDAPEHLPWTLDLAAFQSVLQNLIDNALRYVPRGGRIEVSLSRSDQGLRLAVSDDGEGIAAEQCELVFERFWRGHHPGQPGSGLGLAIVQQAAQRLGGRMRLVEGLPNRRGGHGACFELSVLGKS
ncbi:HAMP domain-containing histidine kinase [Pelomonas sp. V22]|uniref:sensor histidine kinase n=1 Tax=Pelomonas sp. V22 TaxID=2822139 RepID=UPI0024A9FA29|nr:HAMP domain-containing sensor histidine kinase [Pelomonas sp. V22]MDI4631547.1 HAMP domain-containing histidine kinase [Pelomonas sp. V22]